MGFKVESEQSVTGVGYIDRGYTDCASILGRLPEGRYEDDIQEEYPSYVYAEVYKVTITIEKV